MPDNSIYQQNGKDTLMVTTKAYIAMMDILAHNNWERPICYVATTGSEAFFGLEDYFEADGMVYRLTPIVAERKPPFGFTGRIDSKILYDNLMNKFNLEQYAQRTFS